MNKDIRLAAREDFVIMADGWLTETMGNVPRGTPLEFLHVSIGQDVRDSQVRCRYYQGGSIDGAPKDIVLYPSEIRVQNESRLLFLLSKALKKNLP